MDKDCIEDLLKTTFSEMEKMLDAKMVIGEPMKVEGITLIPLVSYGFGLGAGGGGGKYPENSKGKGEGIGSGGGGGVNPVALIVMDEEEVRIEPIKGGLFETVADSVASVFKKKLSSNKKDSA